MKPVQQAPELRMIPLDRIEVLNPRERNQHTFDQLIESIGALGLKKPVTVTPRPGDDGAERYLLICGEGRLKAFQKLGQPRIPALVVTASEEDAFVMSLVENIARRRHPPLELLRGITQLRAQSFQPDEIARMTHLHASYVRQILELIDQGEERLLVAVEQGRIPITVATFIAKSARNDKAVQAAMQQAYEAGEMKRPQLAYATRLVERRKRQGAALRKAPVKKPVTASALVREYQRETERQRQMVRKSGRVQQQLLFICSALRQMLDDEKFLSVLRHERLDTLPKYLAERLAMQEGP